MVTPISVVAMATDHIRYDLLAQDALRGVVRSVLADTAKNGLPGEHHFYISFDTNADGVRMSARLREQYPQEMTIILQHQFWDLEVAEDHFDVGLSFNGVPERLTVPFEAVKSFFDPAVQFGLQFETIDEQRDASSEKPREKPRPSAGQKSRARPKVPAPAAPTTPAPSAEPKPADKPEGGGEVVRLDRFRKK
jgi:uncharacterized protein